MSGSVCLCWIEAADNAQTIAKRTEAPCGDDPAAARHSLPRGAALVDVNEATLSEMTDTGLATRDDYHVIADWQH
jgi:hypothetical protein